MKPKITGTKSPDRTVAKDSIILKKLYIEEGFCEINTGARE
ncbi:MAG: hypothetical protein PXX82_02370 [Methanomassiliicoccales archaeon]|nr:hypothetical protein [Methanomassiliicoccales archaeon]